MKNNLGSFIGEKIKLCRESIGISQSELARKSDLTSAAISQIESGNRVPAFTSLLKIAQILNLGSLDCFLPIFSQLPRADEMQKNTFYIKYGAILRLSKKDQDLVIKLIDRLLDE